MSKTPSANQLVVEYLNGQTRYYPIGPGRGWGKDWGGCCLMIGRGVPRTMIPLASIAAYTVEQASSKPERPTIVVLCGSTRFYEAFRQANLDETLAGRIVLSIGCDMKSDAEVFAGMDREELDLIKDKLDALHKRKIDLADEVLVLNVGGYIGDSTRGEIEYATALGKPIRWLEEPLADWERDLLTQIKAAGLGEPGEANDKAPASTAWCGNPDHDDPCDNCEAILGDASDALRQRMPTGNQYDVAAGIDPYAIPANRIGD